MARAAQRISGLGTTVFAEMSALALATGAINLGQGFPDTDGPGEILRLAADTVLSGADGANQYPPGLGILPLRRAIAAHQQRCYGLAVDPHTEVLVTTGATEAIAAAALALVESGDEVLALEPYYDSYAACVRLAGGRLAGVTLRPPDFRLDPDALKAALTPRTRLVLLNSPHNPTGSVLSTSELQAVADIAIERDLVVLADEVYEHLTFDGHRHLPIASLPGMAERTLTIGSAGKSFSVTGWKVGWVSGPAELVAAVRTVKQFLTYVSAGPLQPAVAAALDVAESIVEPLRAQLQAQRDLLCDGLDALGLRVYRPQGTYFATTDVRAWGFDDGEAFCRWLPPAAGVVAIPHQVFYDDVMAGRPLVRWAFCKRPAVLQDALARLEAAAASRSTTT